MCLRVGVSWFVAAVRGECEGGKQEEERVCLVHIAYFLFRAAEISASGMGEVGNGEGKAPGEAREVDAGGLKSG